jgi:hypothetical protein
MHHAYYYGLPTGWDTMPVLMSGLCRMGMKMEVHSLGVNVAVDVQAAAPTVE